MREQRPEPPRAALEEARESIRRVMRMAPDLTHFGFGIYERKSAAGYSERFREQRRAMLADTACAEFIAASEWLERQGKTRRINPLRGSSYGLKHEAERLAGQYISNGMLIAAAVALAFQVGPVSGGGPNARLNVSNRPLAARRKSAT